jgi:hypothetical protein
LIDNGWHTGFGETFVGAVDATSGSSRHTALMRLVKLSLFVDYCCEAFISINDWS